MKIIIIIILAFFIISCNYDTGGRQPWPGGKVPFILAGFTPEQEFEVIKAMITWELASGGKIEFFIYGTRQTDTKPIYIFKSNEENKTNIGYDPHGFNFINIKDRGGLLHELGHVLGLIHEYQRLDRNIWIDVNIECIPDEFKLQFYPMEQPFFDYRKYPVFDYSSVMMDPWDCLPGAVDGRGHEIGGDFITALDALKIRDIYSEKTQ